MSSRPTVLWLPLMLSLAAIGCEDDLSLTEPTPTAETSVETFAGTLTVGATSVYSFTVMANGAVAVTLASVSAGRLSPIDAPLRLGLGVPSGTGCQVTEAIEATAGLTPHLARDLVAGTYCVDLRDVRGLSTVVRFSVRIVHS